MIKIVFLVFFAMKAVSSAQFCCGSRIRTLYQKADFDMANLNEIVNQIQRIGQIDWGKLENIDFLKKTEVEIIFANGDTKKGKLAYFVALLRSFIDVDWESFNSKMPSKKESFLKEISTLLYRFSVKLVELFDKFVETDANNSASHLEQGSETYHITIDKVPVNMIKVADRLEKFSKIDWDLFNKKREEQLRLKNKDSASKKETI